MWLCFFFLVFHAWTNFWAEVTRFADKQFYSDWWNAGNLGEYWRKWNHPIHNWLVRHCYYPLIRRGINPELSRFLTFTLSAIAHEYIVAGTLRVFNLMAFTFMIINVPIMHVQKQFRHTLSSSHNNLAFWLCYCVVGQPLCILVGYYQSVSK